MDHPVLTVSKVFLREIPLLHKGLRIQHFFSHLFLQLNTVHHLETAFEEGRHIYMYQYYCKCGNFHEIFIFPNSIKRHICYVKKSGTGHDLPISVKDRVTSPICEGLIFTKLREN